MPVHPIITFKAGQCEVDTASTPHKVKPQTQAGYIYLYSEDDLVHFCWRKRSDTLEDPQIDLVMVPTDGSFVPYEASQPAAQTNGRIFVLKFASSSQRHLFWMQSKPQSRVGDPSWFSPRDRKIGSIVHRLLQGQDVNVTAELAAVRNPGDRRDDDDEPMEDAEGLRRPHDHPGSGSGGAGPGATGGDIREEGEGSREGGADGARAADAAVANLLRSLRNQPGSTNQRGDIAYPSLVHLLPPSETVSMVDRASPELVDTLLDLLPPAVVVLASGLSDFGGKPEPTTEAVTTARQSLSLNEKCDLLKKVLRSPQFYQALGSLTMALRDGGLPGVADALGFSVENGGYITDSNMPLGGGQAIKAGAFVPPAKTNAEATSSASSATFTAMDVDFPTCPDDFQDDERISYSKKDEKFIAVHDDGTEFEFDAELKQWIPMDEESDDAQDIGGDEPKSEADDGNAKKRRRSDAENEPEKTDSSASARPRKKPKPAPKPKQNTAVYVTGLPSDATVSEIHEVFSRKGGLIAEEIDSKAPRIKLYKDDKGNFKGDALVVFFKPESVSMAIMLLDDTDFRYTAHGKGEGRMRVQEADSSYKKVQQEDRKDGEPRGEGEVGRPRQSQDRRKVIKKTQKLDAKLADWSDDEDDRFAGLVAPAKAQGPRTVVLRQMFRIFELEEDPASVLEIKEDIRDECSKMGLVTSVVLYDQEPEGIVTVKFQEAEAAAKCVKVMGGRPFDGRVVNAAFATGQESFRRTGATEDSRSD
ncbi:hypothetical protein L249_3481 [Ophiocordyceps polyrhachis-furcata BCC 54312]|uniref:Uncharacterized protein n=1 Tax=Ophiocordyceps polyrhachis-furcata BCC 54312 TaxID=1330021 RepID=A0A367LMN9_9HYPO|nr:hypothetical protein L249_3481 [Ophiocordyceps polyrhachis-furcata BCC 54312]